VRLLIACLTVNLVCQAGCTVPQLNRGSLLLSSAAIACDAVQTTQASAGKWVNHEEANPILHDKGPIFVGGYFIVTLGLNYLAWRVAPDNLKAALGGAIVGAESWAVANSAHRHFCWE